MSNALKCLVCFWLWIAVILVSFLMIVISIVASAIPHIAVAIFAVVIFALAAKRPSVFGRRYNRFMCVAPRSASVDEGLKLTRNICPI